MPSLRIVTLDLNCDTNNTKKSGQFESQISNKVNDNKKRERKKTVNSLTINEKSHELFRICVNFSVFKAEPMATPIACLFCLPKRAFRKIIVFFVEKFPPCVCVCVQQGETRSRMKFANQYFFFVPLTWIGLVRNWTILMENSMDWATYRPCEIFMLNIQSMHESEQK